MKYSIDHSIDSNNDIIINVFGTIDTINSNHFGDYVFDIYNKYPNSKLYINFSNVYMITSSCIRELLRFVKSNLNFELIGVKKEVYTVLKLTNMAEVLHLDQETISVNVEGCKVLGKGFHSSVYKLDDERIAKIYSNINDIDMFIHERIVAKQAFVKGVPTEISFGMCECDGKPGLIYELVDADTLLSIFAEDESNIDKYVDEYVELVKKMHTFDSVGLDNIDNIKEKYRSDINLLKPLLNDGEVNKLYSLLESIEDSNNIIHGDPHPANVMLTNKGMVFIDLSDMMIGNGIFDLVYLHRTLIQFMKVENSSYKLNNDSRIKLWNMFFNEYYKEYSNEDKKNIEQTINLLSLLSITAKFVFDKKQDTSNILLSDLKQALNN